MNNKLYPPDIIVGAMKVEVGTKVVVRDFIYNEIIKNEYINNNFILKAKRLNRWYYDIYFNGKGE